MARRLYFFALAARAICDSSLMDKHINVKTTRTMLRRCREDNRRLRSALFTTQMHYARDIADLEARLLEIEGERDFYKRKG